MSARMAWTSSLSLFLVICLAALAPLAEGRQAGSATQPSSPWAGYRTVANAIPSKFNPTFQPLGQPGYLGIDLEKSGRRQVHIERVDVESPAAQAGLKENDVIVKFDGKPAVRQEVVEQQLLAHAPGDVLKLTVTRDGKNIDIEATLGTVSRPMSPETDRRVVLGVQTTDAPDNAGAVIERVLPDMPAEKAGIQAGDIVVDIDNVAVATRGGIAKALEKRTPDETVTMKVRRGDTLQDLKVKLAAESPRDRNEWSFTGSSLWKKDVYHVAVITIEYPDIKNNPKITPSEWEEALFSKGKYRDKNSVTGQPVFGSLNDYYLEQSSGGFHVEGKVFAPVTMPKERADYGHGTGDNAGLLNGAIDLLLAREGNTALKDFDGLIFIYAGTRVKTTRGGVYWPHKGYTTHQGRRWPILICPEGGDKMQDISVFCHEFGHMLGLPDLYARPENPGSEGLGIWCLMSQELKEGRPQHMCAWSKEQLGWVKPVVIDPRVKQRLILSPIENSAAECIKVLAREDGSEFFLLENREKAGFDVNLPGGGLLIWRVVRGRPMLEESTGIEGPAGPKSFLTSIPYPSPANKSFTPYTTPSSRSQLGGGMPVFITDIERIGDGRIAFSVGYEYF